MFPSILPELHSEVSSNIFTYLEETNRIFQNELENTATVRENPATTLQNSDTKQKSIFVCTFCQVFSSSSSAIASHIGKEHGSCLKEGTIPENYVSKLQALKNDANYNPRRVGRPRKETTINLPVKNETKSAPDPVMESDGLYWCKKCHKHFKKPRQFIRHVCFEDEFQEDEIEDIDCDDTVDFKQYMNVQPDPWTKKKKFKAFEESNTAGDKNIDKIKVDFQDEIAKSLLKWRDDPKYIPLFKIQEEKIAFENHLKSIDYKCVDAYIERIRKKSNFCKSNSNNNMSGFVYSCTICEKVFNTLSHARLHCLIHTDLKPFTCTKCSYRTNTKSSLHTHMRKHTGNVFQCAYCSFQSEKRSHIQDHEQTHLTIRQGCKLCKNSYKTLRSLKFHVKTYHNNPNGKRYLKSLSAKELQKNSSKCDICDRTFASISKLESHKLNDHPIPISIQLENQIENELLIEQVSEMASEDSSEKTIEITAEEALNNSLEDISRLSSGQFSDLQYLPQLLDCSVRIEPLVYQIDFKCSLCDQKFLSHSMLENHTLLNHPVHLASEQTQSQGIQEKMPEQPLDFNDPQVLSSLLECSVIVEPLDEQLVELMLNNLLNEKTSQPVSLFENVFQEPSPTNLLISDKILTETLTPEKAQDKLLSVNNIDPFHTTNPTLLQEHQKKLHIDLLNECLLQSSITSGPSIPYLTPDPTLPSEGNQSSEQFNIPEMSLSFPNNQLIPGSISGNSNMLTKDLLQFGSELDEQKSEEIKLFEKCKRAPAYVCCVCSSIFINPTTLKAHLKEHVDKNKSFIEPAIENFQLTKLSESKSTLENVCDIIQESSTNDVENEVEKLYTSSLHSKWYLPEVSVVLENDQSLIDAFLDDISNLPISDKFEDESLQLDSEIFS